MILFMCIWKMGTLKQIKLELLKKRQPQRLLWRIKELVLTNQRSDNGKIISMFYSDNLDSEYTF